MEIIRIVQCRQLKEQQQQHKQGRIFGFWILVALLAFAGTLTQDIISKLLWHDNGHTLSVTVDGNTRQENKPEQSSQWSTAINYELEVSKDRDAASNAGSHGSNSTRQQQQQQQQQEQPQRDQAELEQQQTGIEQGPSPLQMEQGPPRFEGPSEGDNICQSEATKTNFRRASGLYAIVAGMEHSGTTVVSQLIMSHPALFGAFEGGMLAVPSPRHFPNDFPFYEWSIEPESWGLTIQQRQYMTKSECFAEMYRRLRECSPIFQKSPLLKDNWLVDKTPRYVYNLPTIMERTPGVPVVVTQKNDLDQLRSLDKRHNMESDGTEFAAAEHLEMLQKAKDSLQQALRLYPDRIFVVNTTQFYAEPDMVMRQVYEFLGLGVDAWKHEYLTMNAYNAKALSVPGLLAGDPFDPKSALNNTDSKTAKATADVLIDKVRHETEARIQRRQQRRHQEWQKQKANEHAKETKGQH